MPARQRSDDGVIPRDRYIIESVYRHRFLNTPQIEALTEAHPRKVQERVKKLRERKFLTKIPLHRMGPGSEPLVVALANAGAELLGVRGKTDYTNKNRDLKAHLRVPGSVRHTLATADVLIPYEVACRTRPDVTFETLERLLARAARRTRTARNPLHWKVGKITFRKKEYAVESVVPDGGFGLHVSSAPEGQQNAYFFPEIDLGTMTIEPERGLKASIVKKILCYRERWLYWKEHPEQHPFPFMRNAWRVPFVTTSPGRAKHFREACHKVLAGRGVGQFLFTDFESLAASPSPLEHLWIDGRGKRTTLTDE